MIQYVNQRTLPDMVSYCRYNPFGCKIASLALAYGLDVPFTGFWIQIDRTGAITAALSKLEGAAVLYAQENADTEELREFLPMAGVKLFLYSPETISIPRIESITTGWVMKLHSSKEVPKHSYLLEYNPSLRQIHSLLCACTKKGFQPPPLDLFMWICLTEYGTIPLEAQAFGKRTGCLVVLAPLQKPATARCWELWPPNLPDKKKAWAARWFPQ